MILFSVFDGMESAALILRDIGCHISLHLSWEVGSDCIALLRHHFSDVQIRGDFLRDDAAQLVSKHGPEGSMIVLLVGAPPCPDFSQINRIPQAPRVEGQKFSQFCDFAIAIEDAIPHKRVGYR